MDAVLLRVFENKRLKQCLLMLLCVFIGIYSHLAQAAIDPKTVLPPLQAFKPTVFATENDLTVQFDIAPDYYLYQQKIQLHSTAPELGAIEFSPTQSKTDEFFGTQPVYYRIAQLNVPFTQAHDSKQTYQVKLTFQGCAEMGICYPPTEAVFEVNQVGLFAPVQTPSNSALTQNTPSAPHPTAAPTTSKWSLNGTSVWQSLLTFFVAGIGLSLTACMYPLLPIVSSIVVGEKRSRRIAFLLSMLYVQGLAITYSAVGVITALTGSLLMVWLQQPMVVLSAAALLVVLALAMFDVINIQLPSRLQSFFQQQSSRLQGGKLVSVLFMGMLSALIVGPCVAPPLAFALGYIAQSGNAVLGGSALYAMALGTGLPLVIVATFGAQILPKAGVWMNAVKVVFGCLLLTAAVYLARPFLPYWLSVCLYGGIFALLGLYFLMQATKVSRRWYFLPIVLGASFTTLSGYLTGESLRDKVTPIHRFLSLQAPNQAHFGQRFTDVQALQQAIAQALRDKPEEAVIVDFYADWCVTCIQMQMNTFTDAQFKQAVDETRFFTIDVTANTPEQQALLKQYGLFGPPGIFKITASQKTSEPLLGFVDADDFIAWLKR